MYTIVGGLLCLYFIYTIIPYTFSFGFSKGVLKHIDNPSKIAFTFDDGPDPYYTPILLDLLTKYNVKATFFVLGSKAEQHPELILRMHKEGHLLGVHNYVHRSNWVMFPWTLRRELDKSAAIVEKITGDRPIYYRPPWGLLNLFDLFLLHPYRIVLWSVMAGDWKSKGGSEKVKKKLLQNIKNGDIILLHDCGDTLGADFDAPMNTIKALNEVLPVMNRRGLTCVRIDEI